MDQELEKVKATKVSRRRLIGTSAVGVPAMLLHLPDGSPAAAEKAVAATVSFFLRQSGLP